MLKNLLKNWSGWFLRRLGLGLSLVVLGGAFTLARADYTFRIIGSSHVVAGFSSYILYQRTDSPSSPTYAMVLRYKPPAGITFVFPNANNTTPWAPSTTTPGYLESKIHGNLATEGLLHIFCDPSVAPGTYMIPMEVQAAGVKKTLTRQLIVEPAPSVPSKPNWGVIPPIPMLSRWEERMSYGKTLCNRAKILENGPFEQNTWSVWYYDGALVYHQIADYTGDESYRACANYVLEAYRDNYLLPADGKVQWYRIFPYGMRIDYRLNGDPRSLEGIRLMAKNEPYVEGQGAIWHSRMRETAYATQVMLSAHGLGQDVKWRAAPEMLMGQIDQVIDGAPVDNILPYMTGLVTQSLIEYFEVSEDPRVLPAVKKIVDWIWDNSWVPADHSFVYDIKDPGRGLPDLNNLIAPAYAWLWAMTGDRKYLERGDEIFSWGIDKASWYHGKTFSQNYRWSFKYVQWRQNPETAWLRPPQTPKLSGTGPFPTEGQLTFQAQPHALDSTLFLNFSLGRIPSAASSLRAPAASGRPGHSFSVPGWTAPLAGHSLRAGIYGLRAYARNASGASDPLITPVSLSLAAGKAFSVFVYPNPWRSNHRRGITFMGFPANGTLKIFTISGHLVKQYGNVSGQQEWDLTNESGERVASGIYLFLAEGLGDRIRGKFAVIR